MWTIDIIIFGRQIDFLQLTISFMVYRVVYMPYAYGIYRNIIMSTASGTTIITRTLCPTLLLFKEPKGIRTKMLRNAPFFLSPSLSFIISFPFLASVELVGGAVSQKIEKKVQNRNRDPDATGPRGLELNTCRGIRVIQKLYWS